jgi:dTDP-4-amino-4,6-dideoxygalactose transaminase
MPTSDALEAICKYLSIANLSASARQMHLCGAGAVAELEEKLKHHYGMRHALCVSNATVGLLAVALALDLKRAEFVTTPYTYGASLAGWLLLGNSPIFADIDPHTLTLDDESVRRRISSRTRALLAVDIFGTPADTIALRKLSDEFGIWYIADAAQSLGAVRDGLPASALSDALVVSFTTGKTVFAGEGGAILTNHTDLYQKLVWHTQHPARQCRDLGLHLWNELALNARIHPLAAVWANAVFEESVRKLRRRQKVCFRLIEALNSIGLTEPIHFKEKGIEPSFFRLTAAWKDRPQESVLLRELGKRNLAVNLKPPPVRLIYQQPSFVAQYRRRSKITPCPQAERQARIRFCIARKMDEKQTRRSGS